jgi:uncharacterized protein YajQ (UPF0234 family)
MELEIYNVFVKAGISESEAKTAVESISKEIDKRYALHSNQLATRGDVEGVRKEVAYVQKEIAEVKSDLTKQMMVMQTDLIKWIVGAMFAGIGVMVSLVKLLH